MYPTDDELIDRARYLNELAYSVPEGSRFYLTDLGSQYILDNLQHLNPKERGSRRSRVEELIEIGETGYSKSFDRVFGGIHLGSLLEKGLIDYE